MTTRPTEEEAITAMRVIIRHLGEDPTRPGLVDTPRRFVRAMEEMTSGYKQDPQAILSRVFVEGTDQMVLVRDVPFHSLCEHHLLPFSGTATIGYLPRNGRVLGLSKMSRVLQCYARRLQVQERLTQEVAQAINRELRPLGVGVLIRATHECMSLRGVQTPAEMVTNCLLGAMRTKAREEFLRLAL